MEVMSLAGDRMVAKLKMSKLKLLFSALFLLQFSARSWRKQVETALGTGGNFVGIGSIGITSDGRAAVR